MNVRDGRDCIQTNREMGPLVVMVEPTAGQRGPQQTLLSLLRFLHHRWQVVVAVPEGYVSARVRAEMPEINLLPLPVYPSRAASWMKGLLALAALRHERRRVLIHASGLSALNLAAPVARRLSAPVLVHFHASEISLRSRLFLSVWKRLGIKMRFFPVSNFAGRLLKTTSVRDAIVELLPNPIDCAAYRFERIGAGSAFRIGYVGSKSPLKGLHRLIEIASLLKDEPAEWHVYGIDLKRARTPYIDACLSAITRAGLGDRIKWWSKVADPRLAFMNVDALLIPSSRESFSRVALEGMAARLPVVASRIPGLEETLEDGVSGLLFDPLRPDEAAGHLRRLIHGEELRMHLSRGALERAQQFDISRIGTRLESAYQDLLGDPLRKAS